ncbi:hypothetical protein BLNAU_21389 [Blattamonas nauphoetae]|uniref:Uncharacterized protein n=1 Tax=Blattamonas nauphoetae TaxID=2049346 RepID=A0ABQ9WW06_9EUKA|nr:hypothetical protein BLNAU_21389 [Blattamonas nauphoetae]
MAAATSSTSASYFTHVWRREPSLAELFGDSLFLSFLLSPLLHYLYPVLSVTLLHPLGPNERSLIEQFVDEDGVIILHRLYCIVFSPLLVGYLDVLTQRQTNSDILKTPFSQQFLASFTSTLFHLLSIIMLSYENLSKHQTLSFSKGHTSAGPLGKEFKSNLTASPPLRLFNPRPSLRMSIVRQPTPATPQQFTAGRSPHPLDENFPKKISGDMRLTFVHPGTRFESDNSDSRHHPALSRPRLDAAVHVRHERCSERIQRRTRRCAPHAPSLLPRSLPDTLQRGLPRNIVQSDAESTADGDNADCGQTRPSSEPKLERHLQRARSEAAKTKKSSGLLNISAIEGILILGLLFIPLDLPTTLPVTDYAPLPPMSSRSECRRSKSSLRARTKPLHHLLSMLTISTPPMLIFEAVGTMPPLTQRRQRMLLVSVQIITHSLLLLKDHKMQLVKYSGIFHAWWVGQDETAKTQLQIRKGWDGECEGDEADWVHTVLRSWNGDNNELMTQ